MKKFLTVAGIAAALMFAFSCTDNGNPEDKNDDKDVIEINAGNLAGSWEGGVEHDFGQGYLQNWRIRFEGDTYTTWHTSQTAGTIYDEPGLKTVGNKEKGEWEFSSGVLTLTPVEQYASYAITSMDPMKHTFYEYDPVTMEAVQWFETPSSLIEQGIQSDILEGTDWYIKKWNILKLTKDELTVRINKDTFVLKKK